MKISFKKLRELAPAPQMFTSGNGFLLKACLDEPITINPGESVVIPTGVSFIMEEKELSDIVLVMQADTSLAPMGLRLANDIAVIVDGDDKEILPIFFNAGNSPCMISSEDKVVTLTISRLQLLTGKTQENANQSPNTPS